VQKYEFLPSWQNNYSKTAKTLFCVFTLYLLSDDKFNFNLINKTMEQKANVWKANLTNGLILAMIGIVYTLVMYFLDLTINKTQGYVFLLILVVSLFFLVKSYRVNYLHGYMTYGQAVGAGVVIFLYYAILMAVFTYILYAVIDPGLIDKQLAASEEMLAKRGLPQEAMDASLKIQKKMMKPEIMAPISIFGNMLYGVIMSLIVAIFAKKEGNPLIDSPEVK
jgi:Protein of unknown function (DUF4199)